MTGQIRTGGAGDDGICNLCGEGQRRRRGRLHPVHRAPRGEATAKIAFLIPTASYLAYSNEHLSFGQAHGTIIGHTTVLGAEDLYLYEHPEFGLSTYDHHADGSGVCYVSRLRPIPNMRPHHRFGGTLWGLAADLHLVDWLNAKGFRYDVITDEDLHREGAALLRGYNVVLTGRIPSTTRRDARRLEAYLTSGGRVMYLGGNGFYWITSYHPDQAVSGRSAQRREGGSRAWEAQPGEYFSQTTGERGGVWRNRARPPQKLVGVGLRRKISTVRPTFGGCPTASTRAGFIFGSRGR